RSRVGPAARARPGPRATGVRPPPPPAVARPSPCFGHPLEPSPDRRNLAAVMSPPLGVLPPPSGGHAACRAGCGVRGSRARVPSMRCMLAVVWHYWIGVALTVGVLLTVV